MGVFLEGRWGLALTRRQWDSLFTVNAYRERIACRADKEKLPLFVNGISHVLLESKNDFVEIELQGTDGKSVARGKATVQNGLPDSSVTISVHMLDMQAEVVLFLGDMQGWRREFYPTSASTAARDRSVPAARHSLRKWQGLQSFNLLRYGLVFPPHAATVRPQLPDRLTALLNAACTAKLVMDIDSCSLCRRYLRPHVVTGACAKCPLYKLLGNKCDHGSNSPFSVATSSGDVGPMITALRRTVLLERREMAKEKRKGSRHAQG